MTTWHGTGNGGTVLYMVTQKRVESLVSARQAAGLLGVSEATLKQWRLRDRGPAYVRLGGRTVRYERSALIDWARRAA